jgi:hypothetical protein
MKESVVSRIAAVASLLLLTIKSKAMKKQMKDPGCGCGSGCCTGAMVD